MPNSLPSRTAIIDSIKSVAVELSHVPSRAEFKARSGITESQVLRHFANWREAVRSAGFVPNTTYIRLEDNDLLSAWGEVVRNRRSIPTRQQYKREGKYHPGSFEKRFGPWSSLPKRFLEFAAGKPEWTDVVTLLPKEQLRVGDVSVDAEPSGPVRPSGSELRLHSQMRGRPTYGAPLDFRGLRHAPKDELGVVFLFGIVARELGYHVEQIQAAFPDCEAKRQVNKDTWQRVRIEFEYESRNFRDHGHSPQGCDVIVCWRHNWPECPPELEVVDLSSVIKTLAKSED